MIKIWIFTDLDQTSQIDSPLIYTHSFKIWTRSYVCDWFYSRSKFDSYTRGLWAVTTVLVVFFFYLPEKFKVFDKKLVHRRVESEECVVAKSMESYVCVSVYRVIKRLLKLLLPPISAVYIKIMRCQTLTSNKIKRKRGNSFKFWRNTDQVVENLLKCIFFDHRWRAKFDKAP